MEAETEIIVHSIDLIVSKKKVRGGRPCIRGTGFRVTDVVMAMRYHDMTPNEIAEGYAVPIAGVHAALSYYYEHQAEIDADIEEQIRVASELKQEWLENNDSLLPR